MPRGRIVIFSNNQPHTGTLFKYTRTLYFTITVQSTYDKRLFNFWNGKEFAIRYLQLFAATFECDFINRINFIVVIKNGDMCFIRAITQMFAEETHVFVPDLRFIDLTFHLRPFTYNRTFVCHCILRSVTCSNFNLFFIKKKLSCSYFKIAFFILDTLQTASTFYLNNKQRISALPSQHHRN